MIVNLSPEESHYSDTKMTLNFARKSKKIVNYVKVNETFDKPIEHFCEKSSVESAEAESSSDEPPSKQQKMSEITPQPFLSPLIRNQKHLHSELREEMLGRLDKLEKKLLRQICKSVSVPDAKYRQIADADSTSESHDSDSFGDTVASNTTLKEIKHFKQKLSTLKTLPKATNSNADSTNETDDLTIIPESPLFVNPRPFKRKFRSVASSKYIKAPETPDGKIRKNLNIDEDNFNPEAQKRRNEYVLNILNTGSVKILVSDLVTVGPKRAQAIHDYRELYGSFKSFEDLYKVPSLKKKYIENFMKNNLVRL